MVKGKQRRIKYLILGMLLALNIGLLSACRQDGGEANRKEYGSGSIQEVSAIIKDNEVSQSKNEEKIQEGLALVLLDGKYGYIDKNGKEVIAYQYGQKMDGDL